MIDLFGVPQAKIAVQSAVQLADAVRVGSAATRE